MQNAQPISKSTLHIQYILMDCVFAIVVVSVDQSSFRAQIAGSTGKLLVQFMSLNIMEKQQNGSSAVPELLCVTQS